MKTLTEIERLLRNQKQALANEYGITDIGLFGSYVRAEQKPDSDLDILVTLEEPPFIDLFDLVRLQDELTKLLGVQVDLALKHNLKKRIGKQILSEVVPI
ncbi:MAG: nucleotidyltransferase family protein [Ardenticatenaceae bacterium]|nr:nucleotidyltransferase family protein [Ardenticatenaceae bacterium]